MTRSRGCATKSSLSTHPHLYFPGHRTAHRLMPRLLALEAGGGTVRG
jgi:hypothetical protein